MFTKILRRTGAVLLILGVAGLATIIPRHDLPELAFAPAALFAIVAGGGLMLGGPRTALYVRTTAVFLLAAGLTPVAMAPFFQPFSLTLAELRLYAPTFAVQAAAFALVLAVLLWLSLELGRAPVRDAIAGAGIRRWSMQIPAQAGAGVVFLCGLLFWLSLHGQSAERAEALALRQLGPDYRYHLSWISSTKIEHGTSVSGIVTAWNDKEIKTVLLHWETR